MRSWVSYAAVGLVLVAGITLALWPWLDVAGRRSLAVAAAVSWAVQVAAFALLVRSRIEPGRFLAAWAGGTLVRMGIIGAAAFVLARTSSLAPLPTLLGLAGYFFVLLLLEPVFFRPDGETRGQRWKRTDGT